MPSTSKAVPKKSYITTQDGVDSQVFTKYVTKLSLLPRQQTRVSLGHFSYDVPAKGFSVNLNPEPNFVESVVTRVLPLHDATGYELVLHISNHSNQQVGAEVWQM